MENKVDELYGGFTCNNLYELIETLNKYKIKKSQIINISHLDNNMWTVI